MQDNILYFTKYYEKYLGGDFYNVTSTLFIVGSGVGNVFNVVAHFSDCIYYWTKSYLIAKTQSFRVTSTLFWINTLILFLLTEFAS